MTVRVGVAMRSPMVQRYTMGPFEDTEIVRTYDLAGLLRGVKRQITGTSKIKATDFSNTIHGIHLLPRVHLLHLFNTLSIGHLPYVVTYEHYLPRWSSSSRYGLSRMAHPSCRRLIAMSQFAYRYQLSLLAQHGGRGEPIERKLTVLHPSQPLTVDSYDQKALDEGLIRCVFVGRDFFRKGGREVLTVFQQLIQEGLPLDLTVVSSLDAGDYASHATAEDRERARRQLEQGSPSGIVYHSELPNEEVLRLMRRSHLALLPTYDDTYGFSVLEAQAAGCPVITTDVCVMPEISGPAVGWTLEVEKDAHGVARLRSKAERTRLSERIRNGLEGTLREICRSPHQVREKGIRALERISRMHDPASVARAMESIYSEALSAASQQRNPSAHKNL